ncbi:MAG: hypothetical protein MHMPM18_002109 [Marteilia pararefringens]
MRKLTIKLPDINELEKMHNKQLEKRFLKIAALNFLVMLIMGLIGWSLVMSMRSDSSEGRTKSDSSPLTDDEPSLEADSSPSVDTSEQEEEEEEKEEDIVFDEFNDVIIPCINALVAYTNANKKTVLVVFCQKSGLYRYTMNTQLKFLESLANYARRSYKDGRKNIIVFNTTQYRHLLSDVRFKFKGNELTTDIMKLLDDEKKLVTEYFKEITTTKTKNQLIDQWNRFEYRSLLPGFFGAQKAGIFENQVANKRDEYGLIIFAEVLNKLLNYSRKPKAANPTASTNI